MFYYEFDKYFIWWVYHLLFIYLFCIFFDQFTIYFDFFLSAYYLLFFKCFGFFFAQFTRVTAGGKTPGGGSSWLSPPLAELVRGHEDFAW